ncbi:hypothetical protein BpHYR1_048638, partial [Brachionus plicatilis]
TSVQNTFGKNKGKRTLFFQILNKFYFVILFLNSYKFKKKFEVDFRFIFKLNDEKEVFYEKLLHQ